MCDFNLLHRLPGNDAPELGIESARDSFEFTADSHEHAATLLRLRRRKITTTPNRILICRPNGRLGNALLLTPLVQELEKLFPGAEVDIVSACPAAIDIFREYPCVRTIHQLPRLGVRHPLSTLARFFMARQIRYDLIIDPCPRSWSSRFWTRAMRSRADKLGFRSSRKTTGVNCSFPIDDAPRHMAHYPVHLIRQAIDAQLVSYPPRTIPQLSVRLSKEERKFGAQQLKQVIRNFPGGDSVVALFLNATGNKRLPVTFWRQLIDRLQAEFAGMQAIEIVAASGQRFMPEWPSYFSTNIRHIAAVMNATKWFISADCGVMHLGAATKASTIGLFKVTDIAMYAPYGANNTAIQVDEGNSDPAIDQIVQHIACTNRKQVAVSGADMRWRAAVAQ